MTPTVGPLACPRCGAATSVSDRHPVVAQEAELRWRGRRPSFGYDGWALERAREGCLQWACEGCLASGRAVASEPWLQEFCCALPRFAYFPLDRECRDCGSPFVFTAEEQRHWFEELRFRVDRDPSRCPRCREEHRRHARLDTALAQALAELDPADPAQLLRIGELYRERGVARKAADFLARARRLVPDAEELAVLLHRAEPD